MTTVTNGAMGKPVEILLVEDNPGDVRLMLEAFKDSKVHNHLTIVRDGAEALAFLHREDKYANVSRPDLILLGLNLPKKDGREVLKEIKAEENLKCIPVVVLTTSRAQNDILKAYYLHANCYITKPADLALFTKVVRSVEDFWFTIVNLPGYDGTDY